MAKRISEFTDAELIAWVGNPALDPTERLNALSELLKRYPLS